jgi:phosphosulfolactate phosphohydrolase-like enzyme
VQLKDKILFFSFLSQFHYGQHLKRATSTNGIYVLLSSSALSILIAASRNVSSSSASS